MTRSKMPYCRPLCTYCAQNSFLGVFLIEEVSLLTSIYRKGNCFGSKSKFEADRVLSVLLYKVSLPASMSTLGLMMVVFLSRVLKTASLICSLEAPFLAAALAALLQAQNNFSPESSLS